MTAGPPEHGGHPDGDRARAAWEQTGWQRWSQHPSGPPRTLRPVRALGTASLALAVVVTAVEVLSVPAAFSYRAGQELTAYDALGTLGLVAWVAAFVVTCLWLVRVRADAELLAPTYHHARRWGWAWAGWLVPVVSSWFPYQVVRDAVTASAVGAPAQRLPRPPLGGGGPGSSSGSSSRVQQRTRRCCRAARTTSAGPLQLLGAVGYVVALVAWSRVVRTTTLQTAAG